MLQRLRDRVGLWRTRWTWERAFRRWRQLHPGGSYGQFYADGARQRSAQGPAGRLKRPKTLGAGVDPVWARKRAESLLSYLQWAGCRPDHLVVDFGAGSLWIGETLMSYLEPGRYLAMDVVDDFYTDALERLGREVVARRQPCFALISPDSLAQTRSLEPDFVISTAVLRHVRPSELSDYFEQIVSLCGPSTRVIVGHKPGPWTRSDGFHAVQYGRAAIQAALGRLGYEPRFERPPGAPPCQIALFEIVPKGSPATSGS